MLTKKALVTGADGFVGRHISRKLYNAGYNLTLVDLTNKASNYPVIVMDCREFFDLYSDKFDVVIHAAAYVGGRGDIENIRTYIGAYNQELDGALFTWALRTKPKHLICLSSSAVYPVSLQQDGLRPLKEYDQLIGVPKFPDETYGWTKLSLERLAYEYARETGCSVHIVRPFSGYGADQSVKYPFGAFLMRAIYQTNPFEIWGTGEQIRDWIHITDICNAIMVMIDEDIQGPINLCTGIPINFRELARLMIEEVQKRYPTYNPEISCYSDMPSGVNIRFCDPSQMLEFYTPKITLRDTISRALSA